MIDTPRPKFTAEQIEYLENIFKPLVWRDAPRSMDEMVKASTAIAKNQGMLQVVAHIKACFEEQKEQPATAGETTTAAFDHNKA